MSGGRAWVVRWFRSAYRSELGSDKRREHSPWRICPTEPLPATSPQHQGNAAAASACRARLGDCGAAQEHEQRRRGAHASTRQGSVRGGRGAHTTRWWPHTQTHAQRRHAGRALTFMRARSSSPPLSAAAAINSPAASIVYEFVKSLEAMVGEMVKVLRP